MGDPDLAVELVDNHAALAAVPIPPLGRGRLDKNIGRINEGVSRVKGAVRLARSRDTPKDEDLDILAESGDSGILKLE